MTPEGNRAVSGPKLTFHLKMSPKTPNGGAGGETGEPTVCYVYGLLPIPPSSFHFEFETEKNPNTKHSKPSEFVVFFTWSKDTQLKSRYFHSVHQVD